MFVYYHDTENRFTIDYIDIKTNFALGFVNFSSVSYFLGKKIIFLNEANKCSHVSGEMGSTQI
jgi:hypothetical protein